MKSSNEGIAERVRLSEDERREKNWKRWGPYLSERQWGTVREDYSPLGTCWEYFSHDHARSRAYRWGEDGLLGICDRQARLCFALALWNEKDPILKERLFGLTGPEGNHGEDVKELYYYLDATPTASYLKGLYKYPQASYPYSALVEENRRRGRDAPEYEILDTGVFDEDRYFDVFVEYAKSSPDDVLILITLANRGPESAALHVLPTLWFRNTWSWGRRGEGHTACPTIAQRSPTSVVASHEQLDDMSLYVDARDQMPELLFTNNETNTATLFGVPSKTRYTKEAFHDRVVGNRGDAVCPDGRGTKAAAHFRYVVPARSQVTLRARLVSAKQESATPFGPEFEATFAARRSEADSFYEAVLPDEATRDERVVARQAHAGLVWSKQFYHYAVSDWLDGDPCGPAPPAARRSGRNKGWEHTYNRDV
ncbi:MAG TPA: glucosidase, partial [Polyangiaceae bacterium]|nr:glucosidase [Polyangiaceae bacterium]